MRGINSFIVDISEEGIIASGGVYGSTSPGINRLFTTTGIGENILRIYTRLVPIRETVSSAGNNTFILPVAFGFDKVVLFINGDCFIPGVDYTVVGNVVTWLYPDVSIATTDKVVAWGPANEFTANAITLEVINLTDTTVYSGSGVLLNLKGALGIDDSYPFDQNAIYLMANGGIYTPGVDFTYDSAIKQITCGGTPIDVVANRMFTFYYNLVLTPPFRLGEALVRFTKTDGVDAIPLSNPPTPTLVNASNIFLDRKRSVNTSNYRFNYPNFNWLPAGGTPFNNLSVLDVSYFSDLNFGLVVNTAPFGNTMFTGVIPVTDKPISDSKGLLFMNGSLCINTTYDNVNPDAGVTDYRLTTAGLEWVSPTYVVGLSDKFIWFVFKDVFSGSYTKINYYTDITDLTIIETLVALADASKAIVWLNGQAKFQITGELSFVDNVCTVVGFVPAITDQVVTLHFTKLEYAALWEVVDLSGVWTATASKTLAAPAAGQGYLWLFINGFLANPGTEWTLTGAGTILTNVGMGSLPSNTKVVAFYLRA